MSRPNPRPWMLAESTWPAVRDAGVQVAVLPWGATEPHNRHLPHGTDTYEVTAVADAAAGRAWQAGTPVLVLPTVPFGVQTGMADLPFALNMNPSTQAALLKDLAASLAGQGIRKLLVLNGHGGNDFKAIIRELQPRVDVFLCLASWYAMVDPTGFFEAPGDHAGELETSVMLHLHPELVRPLDEAGPGTARPWRMQALREGWVWAPRPWTQVTEDTGVGDPAAAKAARGEAFLAAVAERLAAFLTELAAADPEDLFSDA